MRWRRGLLRSWVVLSVLWVLVVCTGTYLTWPVDDWVLPTGEHFIDPFDAAVKHRLLVNCALLAVGLPRACWRSLRRCSGLLAVFGRSEEGGIDHENRNARASRALAR
jgi:hypothetical protein